MPSISLQKCNLRLPIYGNINRSLKGAVLSTATGGRIAAASKNISVVQALNDISLEIRAGDRVGVMGHNGSGKTSLLRMIAGIYEPSSGQIRIEGRVSSFINLGLGMDPDATGRENVLLCGLMFGLDYDQIILLTPSIADFSGLGEFLDMPVRTYSSGMMMRLVFSIVTSVPAEILLMDEWMSVGDSDFVKLAEARLMGLVDSASILVLASHNEAVIEKLCNIVVRLDRGDLVSIERLAK